MKKIIVLMLAMVLLASMAFSLVSCDAFLGEEWEEVPNLNISHSSAYVNDSVLNNGDGYCDEIYIEFYNVYADTGDENGHYVYKNASIKFTITVDGKDYTHKVAVRSDGSRGGYTACINLKGDVPISTAKSAYIRKAECVGYRKQVPHTYEMSGSANPATCTRGEIQNYKCKDCGGYKEELLSEPLGHDVGENNICTRCNTDFNPVETTTDNNQNSGSSGYIAATYTPFLDLDISPDGIGTRTGTLVVEVFTDVDLISGRGAQSTKEDIIKINGVPQWDGDKLIVSYTVMGYGEADILVDLFSNELNDDFRAEIHVNIFYEE